jgi:esterase/lipase
MAHILARQALFVVTALSLLSLLTGCSGLFRDPLVKDNDSVAEANDAIAEHNALFKEARNLYEEGKEAVEAGEESSEGEKRMAQARELMQEARDNLEEARESLAVVQDLEVDPEVKEYAQLLTDSLDAQLAAEAREIELYEISESDPEFDNNRDRAENLLTKIDDGYKRARDSYSRAQELADVDPNLLFMPR